MTKRPQSNDESTCDDEVFYRYRTPTNPMKFLQDIDAASRESPPISPPVKRNAPSQHMPCAVATCGHCRGKNKSLIAGGLERDGGVRQLLDIGWFAAGEVCVLYFSENLSFLATINGEGMFVPSANQAIKYANLEEWIKRVADESGENDKRLLSEIFVNSNMKTHGYRYVYMLSFNGASLYQIAGLYFHTRNCMSGTNALARNDVIALFVAEKAPKFDVAHAANKELLETNEMLRTKIAAYRKFFSALQITE